jgi:hypothetical protein
VEAARDEPQDAALLVADSSAVLVCGAQARMVFAGAPYYWAASVGLPDAVLTLVFEEVRQEAELPERASLRDVRRAWVLGQDVPAASLRAGLAGEAVVRRDAVDSRAEGFARPVPLVVEGQELCTP